LKAFIGIANAVSITSEDSSRNTGASAIWSANHFSRGLAINDELSGAVACRSVMGRRNCIGRMVADENELIVIEEEDAFDADGGFESPDRPLVWMRRAAPSDLSVTRQPSNLGVDGKTAQALLDRIGLANEIEQVKVVCHECRSRYL
jgi:hypothetical protein